jgi:ParB/RepB/Spo0J family partition protein
MSSNTKKQAGNLPAPTWIADKVVHTPIGDLRPYDRNNRIHLAKGLAKLQASIAKFGFVVPILVDKASTIIAGHGRWQAAKAIGLATVPVVVADHLSAAQVRALRIADNKLAELSEWLCQRNLA